MTPTPSICVSSSRPATSVSSGHATYIVSTYLAGQHADVVFWASAITSAPRRSSREIADLGLS
ncbi:MAG TPA: hypothetical protein VMU75_08040 [Acidimicrobiales bacterium]|nr:hypothetical protein [Acidimicrobiales bacterium]